MIELGERFDCYRDGLFGPRRCPRAPAFPAPEKVHGRSQPSQSLPKTEEREIVLLCNACMNKVGTLLASN